MLYNWMEHLKLIRLAVLDEQVDELGCVLKHLILDNQLDQSYISIQINTNQSSSWLNQLLVNLHEVNILVHGAMHYQKPPLLIW